MNVVANLAELHSNCFELLSTKLKGDFAGLTVAARAARRQRLIRPSMARKMEKVDIANAVARHAQTYRCRALFEALLAEVSRVTAQDSDHTASESDNAASIFTPSSTQHRGATMGTVEEKHDAEEPQRCIDIAPNVGVAWVPIGPLPSHAVAPVAHFAAKCSQQAPGLPPQVFDVAPGEAIVPDGLKVRHDPPVASTPSPPRKVAKTDGVGVLPPLAPFPT